MAKNEETVEEPIYLNYGDAPPMSQQAMRVTKEVFCELTEAERLEKGDHLVRLEVKKEAQIVNKKQVQDTLRKELRETTDEIELVVKALDIGKEMRSLEVLVDWDQEHQEVRTYHPDNHQCVERRRMTSEESSNPPLV